MAGKRKDGAYFRRLFLYDRDSGDLLWRPRLGPTSDSFNSRWAYKPALTAVNHYGVRFGIIEGHQYPAHKVIWAMVYGTYPAGHIKHVNGNKKDNRIANLQSSARDMHLYRPSDAMLFHN